MKNFLLFFASLIIAFSVFAQDTSGVKLSEMPVQEKFPSSPASFFIPGLQNAGNVIISASTLISPLFSDVSLSGEILTLTRYDGTSVQVDMGSLIPKPKPVIPTGWDDMLAQAQQQKSDRTVDIGSNAFTIGSSIYASLFSLKPNDDGSGYYTGRFGDGQSPTDFYFNTDPVNGSDGIESSFGGIGFAQAGTAIASNVNGIKITARTNYGSSNINLSGDSTVLGNYAGLPIILTGVADPVNDNDAVNYHYFTAHTSAQVQTDYDELDPTKPDYLKNKPTLPSLWTFMGNTGEVPGVNYLGTNDASDLEFKVDSFRAAIIEPDAYVINGASFPSHNNVSFGFKALSSYDISDLGNPINNSNTAVGAFSLQLNTTGNGNTAVGFMAAHSQTSGSYNVGIGISSLDLNQTGSDDIGIGFDATPSSGNLSHTLSFGFATQATQSGQIAFGNQYNLFYLPLNSSYQSLCTGCVFTNVDGHGDAQWMPLPSGNTANNITPTGNPNDYSGGDGQYHRLPSCLSDTSNTGTLVPASFIYNEHPSGTINGSNKTFNIANAPIEGKYSLYENGLKEDPATDYSLAGTTLTFTNAPANGSSLLIDYIKP